MKRSRNLSRKNSIKTRMKQMKYFVIAAFLMLTGLFRLTAQNIPVAPNPPKLVNDFAGVLTKDQKDSLESKLVAYHDSTSNEITIVIVKELGGYDEASYALKILRDWGVGGKDKNNGVVVLLSMDERAIRIETGYGLEGAIPDIIASRIIDNDIVPYFKTGNYYRGLDNATNSLIKAAAGEYKSTGNKTSKPKGNPLLTIIIIVIVLAVVSGGAGGGSGRGGMFSRRGFGGGPVIFPGGFGGGGFGGGGRGGGGFGGFGGGSGGGGGASGRW